MVAMIQVQIDAGIKENATRVLDNMGLDHSKAIEIFYRQIVAEGKWPQAPIPAYQPDIPSQEDAENLQRLLQELVDSGKTEVVSLEVSEKGEAIIDKDKYPDLYDWMVNG
ncbi:MAG: type II toxin-antitoxin system RelB/DinJ family antitoxin [Defluviitaleaceae bacterium]|nr:type II toxin-antitoxin system RelB/DinJ family antitoxin [Defluviitaleaceae bacterium]